MNFQQKKSQQIYIEIRNKLMHIYDIFGYEELRLPLFEKYEKYIEYKAVSEESLLKLIDRSGNILVIRPDATFHVLKTIQNMDEVFNRCCYMTNVFRFRENNFEKNDVLQSGIELFDSSSPYADAEVIAVAIESLKALGIENIHIDLGHSQFVHAFLKHIGIRSDADIAYFHKLLDNKNIVALNNSLYSADIDKKYIEKIYDLAMLFGSYDDVMNKAGNICSNAKMEQNLVEISNIFTALKSYGAEKYVHLDLGFSNPMNYYSGIIFKGYVNSHGETVLSGGRYDALAQTFANRLSACGFGQNIDVTIDIMLKKQLLEESNNKTIYIKGSDEQNKALVASALRGRNLKCIVDFNGCYEENVNNFITLNVDGENTEVKINSETKTYKTTDIIASKGAQLC
ncbi:MAG: ATP phosphoribosyltransferase regulatory subunit [Eubacteriaceae bacterium]